jgi:hypothetical protein
VCGYDAQRPTELSYEQDDIVFVSSHDERDGYVQARIGQQNGLVLAANRECAHACTHNVHIVDDVLTPLHEAAKRGNADFAGECLAAGVSVNALDKSGSTPVFWAAHAGYVDILRTLLDQPAQCCLSAQVC